MPLNCTLRLSNLAGALNASVSKSIGVTYRWAGSQINDGYAFQVSGLTVYGVASNGNALTVAFNKVMNVE